MSKKISKKILATLTALTVMSWLVGPGLAQADTISDLQAQIAALLVQINSLTSQLNTLQGGGSGAPRACGPRSPLVLRTPSGPGPWPRSPGRRTPPRRSRPFRKGPARQRARLRPSRGELRGLRVSADSRRPGPWKKFVLTSWVSMIT